MRVYANTIAATGCTATIFIIVIDCDVVKKENKKKA